MLICISLAPLLTSNHTYGTSHTVRCIDADDLELLHQALTKTGHDYTVVEVHDGLEGIRRLHELQSAGTLPCLIVLDVNMPLKDGRETFEQIKADEHFDDIAVVALSTSSSHVDQIYFNGKNAEYIGKPSSSLPLAEIAGRLLSRLQFQDTAMDHGL